MINKTEQDERHYLEVIQEKLELAIQRLDDSVKQYSDELKQNKEYIYEHQSEMDDADMVAAGQSINRMAYTGESAVLRRKKIQRLIDTPYFGRIDFVVGDTESAIYIGIGTFTDDANRENLIYDWRAPISSMFYDYELGEAAYTTPSGKISGNIILKRQYRIRKGRMEFMIENSINIQDDVLQKELSKSSDERMKNIVATIQRDQNQVIRNETAAVMIIQGVAGSGKTSIALHRIAFLLYRFKETLSAKDILIISPNKVFADYISSVLPELGEENIPETGMDELAEELLEDKLPFQTFFQQVSLLLEKPDEGFVARIQFKSSFEFLSKLNQHIMHAENYYFDTGDLLVAGKAVAADFIRQKFRAYQHIPLLKRFPEVVKDVVQYLRNMTQRKITGPERNQVAQAIPRMFKFHSAMEMYRDFYDWSGKKEMFVMPQGKLEYADVFPFLYYKIRLEGIESMQTYLEVKHLIIDEMQDYTPVQYSIISRIFRCNKTILGDFSQTVNPYSSSSAEIIERVFPQAETVKLFRSYRSSWEITQFALRISPNPDLIAMERHGKEPVLKQFENNTKEAEDIERMITDFKTSGYHSLAVICKTPEQATSMNDKLKTSGAYLLRADSTSFRGGIVITTAHLAKGLEFDVVIVPFASNANYHTPVDRSLLYIACTRAMHELTLTWSREGTEFVRPGSLH